MIAAVGLAIPTHDLLLLAIFLMGCRTVGGMTGINGMTAALCPARATSMGWAPGIGCCSRLAGHRG